MSFFEASQLEQWCLSADRKLTEAFEGARNGRTVTQMDLRLLHRSAADQLPAANAFARIELGRALCVEIADHLCVNKHWEHDQPIFFVTLIPRDGLLATDERGTDLGCIKDRLRAHLKGHSYLGMLEPGYYASLPLNDRVPGRQAICWHAHLLIWSVTVDEIANLTRKLRRCDSYLAVVEEMPSCRARQVANGELPDVVAYLLKPPSHVYRVTRYPWVGRDGEVRLKPDGTSRFYVKQLSSELRKGERVRVFHAMKHLDLGELLVAGGEGCALRSRTLRISKMTSVIDARR